MTWAVKRARYVGHLPRTCVWKRISQWFLSAFQNIRVLGFALAVSIAVSLSLRHSAYMAVLPISVSKRIITLLRAMHLLNIWRISRTEIRVQVKGLGLFSHQRTLSRHHSLSSTWDFCPRWVLRSSASILQPSSDSCS